MHPGTLQQHRNFCCNRMPVCAQVMTMYLGTREIKVPIDTYEWIVPGYIPSEHKEALSLSIGPLKSTALSQKTSA
eukprot:scaffold38081_cov17-Prasinocladus_malaysianus.AAC.1